jgi:hypothetical protein
MITMADLRPGMLGFGPIGGLVPGAFPVGAGQILLADRKARLSWRRWWKIRHVLVVTEAARLAGSRITLSASDQMDASAPRAVQAMPRGAEEIELTQAKHWTKEWVFVRPAYDPGQPFEIGLENRSQGWKVAQAARGYIGTPYNFLTYGKLAAAHLHLGLTEAALRKWISTRSDMMCSQLADQCLADAGFHVFDDDRLPQDVVPAELYRKLLAMPGTQLVIPGETGWTRALR